MKATGSEIIAFIESWPPGDDGYVDHEEIAIYADDGTYALDPTRSYDVGKLGDIIWQGSGEPPTDPPWRGEYGVAFSTWFSRWRKARTVTTLVAEVPNAEVEAFLAWCAERKIKVGGGA